MLTGQAKVDYQREYMRRRRAGVAKPPKAEREPTPFGSDRRRNHSRLGWKLFGDIDRDAPDHIMQGVRCLREHRAGLKAKAKAKAKAERNAMDAGDTASPLAAFIGRTSQGLAGRPG